MKRRHFFRLLAAVPAFAAVGAETRAAVPDEALHLGFLDRLPDPSRGWIVDDGKLLLGWFADATAEQLSLKAGLIIDRKSTVSSVVGFAGRTDISGLAGRYRIMADANENRGYRGVIMGLLSGDGAIAAVLVVNRLFRLPVILEEPIGLATDLYSNAGLILGFATPALDAAVSLAVAAAGEARRRNVPLIAIGQSQAGGTAQMQIAALTANPDWQAGQGGFVTFNANCGPGIPRRFGIPPAMVPGINFTKDLDPFVGPHSNLSNAIGLQVYIHPDGTAGLRPRSSYFRAAFHPHEHFLDSFDGISLSQALTSVRAGVT